MFEQRGVHSVQPLESEMQIYYCSNVRRSCELFVGRDKSKAALHQSNLRLHAV